MDYQRLSDHILLGDSLARRAYLSFYTKDYDGSCMGCAIGRAMISVGHTPAEAEDMKSIYQQWPWLTKDAPTRLDLEWGPRFSSQIGGLFKRVYQGEMTIEALAEQVRAWEDLYDDQLRASQEPEVSEVAEREKEEVLV